MAFEHAAAFHKLGVDRHFHFQHVHLVLRLAEFLHGANDDFGLLLGILEAFLVAAGRIVTDELQKERNLVELALGADALDKGMLDVVDVGSSKGV